MQGVADTGSLLELRSGFGHGIVTALEVLRARADQAVNPGELGGQQVALAVSDFHVDMRCAPRIGHRADGAETVRTIIADLEAATIGDVRAFHASHYRPDNATLVVAGDFDAAQLVELVLG